MLKKLSTGMLLVIFVALLAVVFGTEYFFSDFKSKSIRTALVEIDSASVTSMMLYPKSKKNKEFKVYKEGKDWKVKLENGKIASVSGSRVGHAISELLKIKPERLIANDPSLFGEYQVDSTGSRVVVSEGEKKTLDIIIGKFSFKNQRDFTSYVRLNNENGVYATSAFLDMTFNRELSDWRNQEVLEAGMDVRELAYTYPGDSSFTLKKEDHKWKVDFMLADTAKTVEFLKSLQAVTCSEFVDDKMDIDLGPATYVVKVDREIGDAVEIKAYADSTHEWLVTSSINPTSVFKSSKTNLIDKIFPSRAKFIPIAVAGGESVEVEAVVEE